ncbi:MAG: TetR family transcriptional regulator, partial [Nocardia sp.]|nr:TetR family transcriptional regulator [Nocardia sp.]
MDNEETARRVGGAELVRFRLGVVDEALRLFADQGYEATSVDEIAEAAGISRRT